MLIPFLFACLCIGCRTSDPTYYEGPRRIIFYPMRHWGPPPPPPPVPGYPADEQQGRTDQPVKKGEGEAAPPSQAASKPPVAEGAAHPQNKGEAV